MIAKICMFPGALASLFLLISVSVALGQGNILQPSDKTPDKGANPCDKKLLPDDIYNEFKDFLTVTLGNKAGVINDIDKQIKDKVPDRNEAPVSVEIFIVDSEEFQKEYADDADGLPGNENKSQEDLKKEANEIFDNHAAWTYTTDKKNAAGKQIIKIKIFCKEGLRIIVMDNNAADKYKFFNLLIHELVHSKLYAMSVLGIKDKDLPFNNHDNDETNDGKPPEEGGDKPFFDEIDRLLKLLKDNLKLAFAPNDNTRSRLGIGLIGGLNFANLNSTSADTGGADYSNLIGFKGGAVLDVSLGKNFGLRFEPMYLQKGAKRDGLFTDEHGQPLPGKFDLRLSYLELPVLFKYGFGSGKIRPYLVGGAGVSYLLSAKEKFTGGYAIPDRETDIKDEFKSIDFGLSGGAGLSFPLGRASLYVEGRYSHGLANISDVEGFEINTRGVQVMAGCTFPIIQEEKEKKDCCCCINNVSIEGIKDINGKHPTRDGEWMGIQFSVLIDISYKGMNNLINDCNLEWYEKADPTATIPWDDKTGWVNLSGLVKEKAAPNQQLPPKEGESVGWDFRKKECPLTDKVELFDPPSLKRDGNTKTRTLSIAIKITSGCPDSGCKTWVGYTVLTISNSGKTGHRKITEKEAKGLPWIWKEDQIQDFLEKK